MTYPEIVRVPLLGFEDHYRLVVNADQAVEARANEGYKLLEMYPDRESLELHYESYTNQKFPFWMAHLPMIQLVAKIAGLDFPDLLSMQSQQFYLNLRNEFRIKEGLEPYKNLLELSQNGELPSYASIVEASSSRFKKCHLLFSGADNPIPMVMVEDIHTRRFIDVYYESDIVYATYLKETNLWVRLFEIIQEGDSLHLTRFTGEPYELTLEAIVELLEIGNSYIYGDVRKNDDVIQRLTAWVNHGKGIPELLARRGYAERVRLLLQKQEP